MSFKRFAIYVFSYNRPRYLNNCLSSIKRHASDYDLTIFDDGSDVSEVHKVLEKFKNEARIIHRDVGITAFHRQHGGLYGNMNRAMKDAVDRDLEFVCFVQDDQQFVRALTSADIESFRHFFVANPSSFELHACFLKGRYREVDNKRLTVDPSGTAYFRAPGMRQGNEFFSDVGVFHVRRFLRTQSFFRSTERENENYARQQNSQMGFYRFPFMMWIPFPESFRGRWRAKPHQILEWLGGAGFYPLKDLSSADLAHLLSAKIDKLPIAEDYLTCPHIPKAPYWSFSGGYQNVYARGGWRKLLGAFIYRFRKKLASRCV
jgi:glycosyltransferase involved in cell wall biosynthesis